VGERLKADSITEFSAIVEEGKMRCECLIDKLAVEHPLVESAFTGHGCCASRCGERKDSLPRELLLGLPSGFADSPQTGSIDAHRSYLELEALFDHLFRRLRPEVAHNLGVTQDNQMISFPVAANIDSSYSSL
jgi:hypothetical protein